MIASNVTTTIVFQTRFGWFHFWITLCLLGTLILCTIIGNVFVVAAILLEKHLQGVSNYLIVSLAVADLMVATLPMPISAINEVSEDWWLGDALCDFWVCSDVLCCTASILHLVGIALDRYWAVTNAEYIRRRTAKRIGIMITLFWLLSIAISLPARFHLTRLSSWIDHLQTTNMSVKEPLTLDCGINKEYGYTIFSTVGAFYMPMFFMMGIYARIYQVAKARIRRSTFRKRANSTAETELPLEHVKSQQKWAKNEHGSRRHHWNYHSNCFGRLKHTSPQHSSLRTKHISSDLLTTTKSNTVIKSQMHECSTKNGKSNVSVRNNPDSTSCLCNLWNNMFSSRKSTNNKYAKNVGSKWQMPDTVTTNATNLNDLKIALNRWNGAGNSEYPIAPNSAQCHPCLHPLFISSTEDDQNIRLTGIRISHSAPPSVFERHRLSFSSTYSSSESSCSTGNQSDKTDGNVWSSTCSVENRIKSSRDKFLNTRRLYAAMKTLITRRSQANPLADGTEGALNRADFNKKSKWTVSKLRSIRPSQSNCKPFKIRLQERKLSQSFSGPSRELNEVFDDCVVLPIEGDIENVTTNNLYRTRSQNLVEMDYTSGGTLHLEARLKSTVSEVTKLATVTAMVKRERLESQRERKAVVTLAIITGCFMLCWLPFFIVALIDPFYEELRLSKVGQGIILWLGYSNSLLNPIIYTIFSPDFRNAFRKILFGRYKFRYRDR